MPIRRPWTEEEAAALKVLTPRAHVARYGRTSAAVKQKKSALFGNTAALNPNRIPLDAALGSKSLAKLAAEFGHMVAFVRRRHVFRCVGFFGKQKNGSKNENG